jgi:tungstate transport system ATP-binding protein
VSIPVLSAENIKVELGGVPVLDIPAFHLNDKEIITVVGPNGSGKSTLLLTLTCLLKPLSGRILYRGKFLDTRDSVFQYRRKTSMVFQEPLLYDTTVYKNIVSGLKIRGFTKNDSHERAMKYLSMLRIEHLAGRSARKISGGEAQRTSLARAFAIEPEIIFLDEPFSSLDPPTRHDLIDDLERIVEATGTTTVMVTHVEFEAMNLSDRIMVMNGGEIVQTGSPSAVMHCPANEYVARLVGMETILSGTVAECDSESVVLSVSGKIISALGQAHPGETVNCCIRPENIAITTRDNGDAGQNIFEGQITHVYSMGPFLKLNLDCGFALVSLIPRDSFSEMGLNEGDKIYASFKPAAVHLMSKPPDNPEF